jgi:phosphoglycerate dehydrogenase-like enzyme
VFRVGVTADIRRPDGSVLYDLELLDEADAVEWEFMPGPTAELSPEHIVGYDALLCFTARVSRRTLEGADRLKLIARLGVGYDNIDVEACTENGILLTITPDGVRRPMASGAMAFVLALAHRILEKDRHVRAGGWDRFAHPGFGLRGRTLGLLGLGNVGRDIVSLAAPFEARCIAHDPFVPDDESVELVSLETLFRESDFLVVVCPLTDDTRGLVNAGWIASMKPTAFLVNVARGPIVDQRALADALRERRIAGAAVDVFEHEPVDPADPLLEVDNVILTPHAIGLTDEIFRESGRSACRSVLAVAEGRVPDYVVNRTLVAR